MLLYILDIGCTRSPRFLLQGVQRTYLACCTYARFHAYFIFYFLVLRCTISLNHYVYRTRYRLVLLGAFFSEVFLHSRVVGSDHELDFGDGF